MKINKHKINKSLGYVGKTAATITCPPLGLALCGDTEGSRRGLAIVGAVASMAINGFLIFPIRDSGNKIYDNPPIHKNLNINSTPRGLIELFTSPIALYVDVHKNTYLKTKSEDNKTHSYNIKGHDIITFNDGRYSLNFGPESKFGYYGRISLKQAKDEVIKYEKLKRDYIKKGDILKARNAQKDLKTAKADLEKITIEYNQTKVAFQGAVDKMNLEMKSLSQ